MVQMSSEMRYITPPHTWSWSEVGPSGFSFWLRRACVSGVLVSWASCKYTPRGLFWETNNCYWQQTAGILFFFLSILYISFHSPCFSFLFVHYYFLPSLIFFLLVFFCYFLRFCLFMCLHGQTIQIIRFWFMSRKWLVCFLHACPFLFFPLSLFFCLPSLPSPLFKCHIIIKKTPCDLCSSKGVRCRVSPPAY